MTEAPKFKVLNRLTLPQLKLDKNREYYVRFESAMVQGKDMKPKEGEASRKAPMLANIINMETGEHMQIICVAIVVTELSEQYPNNTYVGKTFAIKLFPVAGKNYNGVTLTEIEWNDDTGDTSSGETDPVQPKTDDNPVQSKTDNTAHKLQATSKKK